MEHRDVRECFNSISTCTKLDLSFNLLTGSVPPELGQLVRLTSLDLTGNQLTGSLPRELGQLTQLQCLSVWENDLTGAIPATLGNLVLLETLQMGNNALSGAVPPELDHNQLEGPLPQTFNKLERLTSLEVQFNRLTGTVPWGVWGVTTHHHQANGVVLVQADIDAETQARLTLQSEKDESDASTHFFIAAASIEVVVIAGAHAVLGPEHKFIWLGLAFRLGDMMSDWAFLVVNLGWFGELNELHRKVDDGTTSEYSDSCDFSNNGHCADLHTVRITDNPDFEHIDDDDDESDTVGIQCSDKDDCTWALQHVMARFHLCVSTCLSHMPPTLHHPQRCAHQCFITTHPPSPTPPHHTHIHQLFAGTDCGTCNSDVSTEASDSIRAPALVFCIRATCLFMPDIILNRDRSHPEGSSYSKDDSLRVMAGVALLEDLPLFVIQCVYIGAVGWGEMEGTKAVTAVSFTLYLLSLLYGLWNIAMVARGDDSMSFG